MYSLSGAMFHEKQFDKFASYRILVANTAYISCLKMFETALNIKERRGIIKSSMFSCNKIVLLKNVL